MNNPSAAYWKLRASQRMASYHRSGDKTVNIVSNAYDKAASDIRLEMDKIFKTYATNGKVDPKIAKKILNEKISDKEWNLIKQQINTIKDPDIRRQMLMKLNAPAYRARLTRLQALHEDVYIKSKVLADVEIKQSKLGYVRTIYDAYYKTMYDTQHGLGIGFNFAQMPNYTIQEILMNPWSGQHFSARVWGNTDVLAANLNNILTSGFMSGASRKQMSDQLMAVTDSGKFAANRLIRTEYTYMANQAEHAAYKAADIEQYMFVATLDKKTSIPCRKTDRKVFKVKDGVPGKNMPPLHTWCRSTTIAYFGQETLEGIQRRARDPETGKTMLVPANMSYEQWQKEMDNKYDNGLDNGSKGLKVTDAVRDHAAKGSLPTLKIRKNRRSEGLKTVGMVKITFCFWNSLEYSIIL